MPKVTFHGHTHSRRQVRLDGKRIGTASRIPLEDWTTEWWFDGRGLPSARRRLTFRTLDDLAAALEGAPA